MFAAVLDSIRHLRLNIVLDDAASRERDCALALIAARILEPASKLATSRSLRSETAMGWLVALQGSIEAVPVRRHLRSGTPVLYDLTSTYAFTSSGSSWSATAAC